MVPTVLAEWTILVNSAVRRKQLVFTIHGINCWYISAAVAKMYSCPGTDCLDQLLLICVTLRLRIYCDALLVLSKVPPSAEQLSYMRA